MHGLTHESDKIITVTTQVGSFFDIQQHYVCILYISPQHLPYIVHVAAFHVPAPALSVVVDIVATVIVAEAVVGAATTESAAEMAAVELRLCTSCFCGQALETTTGTGVYL